MIQCNHRRVPYNCLEETRIKIFIKGYEWMSSYCLLFKWIHVLILNLALFYLNILNVFIRAYLVFQKGVHYVHFCKSSEVL